MATRSPTPRTRKSPGARRRTFAAKCGGSLRGQGQEPLGQQLGRLGVAHLAVDAAKHDDDDPLTFNSALAAQGYSIKVSAPDYYYIFNSADIAGNDNIIAANTLDGQPLPETDPANPSKLWYPLKLVGSGLHSGDRVSGIAMIELLGLPAPTPTPTPSQASWDLNGDHICNIGDVVKVGLKWGQTGSAGWLAEDIMPDGIINIGDIVVIGLHWGQSW